MLLPPSFRETGFGSTGLTALLSLLLLTTTGCAASGPPSPAAGATSTTRDSGDLFANPSLWSKIVFGGEGRVEFIPAPEARRPTHRLTLDIGDPLTGVLYSGNLDALFGPSRDGYQIAFEARRIRGSDFFCGVTFPIGSDQHATLILGGWGGSLTGLSSLDGFDASQNGTTQYRKFERNRWYEVGIEVRPARIRVTLDGELLFTVDRRTVEEFSVRAEVIPTVPFGLCTFMTEGEWRGLFVKRFPPCSDGKR